MVVCYRQTLFALSKRGGLSKAELPKVSTTDSMQGKESKVFINDWVITSANAFSDMGFTIDSNRGNVGMSRMTEVMLNILPARVGSDAKSLSHGPQRNHLGDKVITDVPYPCAVVQWYSSEKSVITCTCPTEEGIFKAFSFAGKENCVRSGSWIL
ncbi:AAA domain-containing protein [Aspergillus tubingensis]|uniref:AAA domain-containing protein n=1 Tax=Aspergillus tubingensis TaxID=5068 RepID=UPI001577E45C|nr:AAA domain-domain-containing protein [Aspergillus tubingensis]GFN13842.1 AAA domain-domain-containing protein [Aspergillus tubingensis]